MIWFYLLLVLSILPEENEVLLNSLTMSITSDSAIAEQLSGLDREIEYSVLTDTGEYNEIIKTSWNNILVSSGFKVVDQGRDTFIIHAHQLSISWNSQPATLLNSEKYYWEISGRGEFIFPSGYTHWVSFVNEHEFEPRDYPNILTLENNRRNWWEILAVGILCSGIIYSFYIIK
ncbi:MAG: hypothetical protein ACP5FK_07505 [bacterium]